MWQMNIHLNEEAINTPCSKEPPKYTTKEYADIIGIFSQEGYDSTYLRSILIGIINEGRSLSEEDLSVKFEEYLKSMFHEKIKKILFYSYEDLPLLINRLDDGLQEALYIWRLNRGK